MDAILRAFVLTILILLPFNLPSARGQTTKAGPGACNVVTPSFAEFTSFSRSLISKETRVSRVLTNHNRVFGNYDN